MGCRSSSVRVAAEPDLLVCTVCYRSWYDAGSAPPCYDHGPEHWVVPRDPADLAYGRRA